MFVRDLRFQALQISTVVLSDAASYTEPPTGPTEALASSPILDHHGQFRFIVVPLLLKLLLGRSRFSTMAQASKHLRLMQRNQKPIKTGQASLFGPSKICNPRPWEMFNHFGEYLGPPSSPIFPLPLITSRPYPKKVCTCLVFWISIPDWLMVASLCQVLDRIFQESTSTSSL